VESDHTPVEINGCDRFERNLFWCDCQPRVDGIQKPQFQPIIQKNKWYCV
ncbi:hypothetical protein DYADSP32_4901, partial [Dyadobacter sp. 32]